MDAEGLPLARIPISTYRLQFNRRFTFSAATKILPYLDELGISDIYASPYFMARKGTMVGYDVVDPTRFSQEIGTEEAFNRFARELQKRKMGQILDIVPNHMYVGSEDNAWWPDVLENGPSSPYALFFDIDWNPDADRRSLTILRKQAKLGKLPTSPFPIDGKEGQGMKNFTSQEEEFIESSGHRGHRIYRKPFDRGAYSKRSARPLSPSKDR